MYFQEFVRIVTSNTVLIKRDLVSTKVKMVLSHQMLCHFIAGGQNAFVGVINTSTFKGRKKQSGSFCTCDSSPPVHLWSCKSERCHCDYQWSETIVANSIQHSKHRNSTKFAVYLLPADDPSPSLEIARTCWLRNRRVALVQPPHRDTWIQVLC